MKINFFGKSLKINFENTKQEKPIIEKIIIEKPITEKPISRSQFNKLYPKSWKDHEFYKNKIWKQKGLSWYTWRSQQANLAVNYYIQNKFESQKTIADKFGISLNAFIQSWNIYKSKNKIEVIKI